MTLSPALQQELGQTLQNMLGIASPTYQEQAFVAWLRERCSRSLPDWQQIEHSDCLILQAPWREGKPHIALIGHSDVVPAHFEPRLEAGRLHGAGASDMKGALAAFLVWLEQEGTALSEQLNLSLLVYSREEQTPLHENGLYHLLQALPDYFKGLDLGIIGEPTDNTLQLGCVGSIHARLTVTGKACHSARPWNGENALYKALPIIQAAAAAQPVRHTVFGVDFFDVLQLTESQSEPGRTSLPGWWQANLNFRFAPVRSLEAAQAELLEQLQGWGLHSEQISIIDAVAAGSVIETPLFGQAVQALNLPVVAKQAWTDVAQLTQHGIAAFNFGPGLTSQAHTVDEHILLADLTAYYAHLQRLMWGLT